MLRTSNALLEEAGIKRVLAFYECQADVQDSAYATSGGRFEGNGMRCRAERDGRGERVRSVRERRRAGLRAARGVGLGVRGGERTHSRRLDASLLLLEGGEGDRAVEGAADGHGDAAAGRAEGAG